GRVGMEMFKKVPPDPAAAGIQVKDGLKYEYYEGDFKQMTDFVSKPAAGAGVCTGFDISMRKQDTHFAFRYTGYIRIPADRVYRFWTKSDDGSRLFIDDRMVVENDGLHSLHEESGVAALAAGLHPITVTFFENTGGFDLQVYWSGPNLKKEPIP